jgi:hypothetical protein
VPILILDKQCEETDLLQISCQQTNAVRLLQVWVMSLMLVCAEAKWDTNRFCHNRLDGSFDFYYFVLQVW